MNKNSKYEHTKIYMIKTIQMTSYTSAPPAVLCHTDYIVIVAIV